ncbi:MAG TPA: NAD(P)-binding domain-containing protein, partial [Thermoanaerobaculia bacterium]|nr:NAD(P)-binding domain-containing protein [Thermoanaerobaculia bacterium]
MATLPLTGLRFALAGPGRVGGSLASWIAGAGGRLLRVAGRRPGPAAALAAELGGEAVELGALVSPEADLLLVAVPDDALAPVARELA